MRKILICLCLLLCVVSCESVEDVNGEPSKAVDDYIQSGKQYIENTIDSLDLSDSGFSVPEYYKEELKSVIRDFEYEIGTEKIDGETATVDVNFNTYDLGSLVTSAITTVMKESISLAFSNNKKEDLINILTSTLKEEYQKVIDNGKTKHIKVTFSLNYINGEWVIDEEKCKDSFVDAASGGLYSAYMKVKDTVGDLLK